MKPFDDSEASRPKLPADVLAFVKMIERNVEKGDGGADTDDTLKLIAIVREQAAEIAAQRTERTKDLLEMASLANALDGVRSVILAPALPDKDVPRVIGQIVDERNALHIAICDATAKPYTEHFDRVVALVGLRAERNALRERLAKLETLLVRAYKHFLDEGVAEDCECRGCKLCQDLAKELPT